MHFCIMPQRFIMANAFNLVCNGFLIEYASLAEGYIHIETALHKALQHFKLYFAHKVNVYLL